MYVRHSDLYVRPEHIREYTRLLSERVRAVRGSSLSVKRVDLMQSFDNPNLMLLLEIFRDKASWEAVSNGCDAKAFETQTKPWLVGDKQRLTENQNIEPTDAEWDTAYVGVRPMRGWPAPRLCTTC